VLAYDVVFILNRFVNELSSALGDSHGHYAQFAGDGLMALYGLESERKARACQDAPACDPGDQFAARLGKVASFLLHAGVAAKAHERNKLERLCRYIARPPVSEQRLSLTAQGKVRYGVKTPCN